MDRLRRISFPLFPLAAACLMLGGCGNLDRWSARHWPFEKRMRSPAPKNREDTDAVGYRWAGDPPDTVELSDALERIGRKPPRRVYVHETAPTPDRGPHATPAVDGGFIGYDDKDSQ